MKLSVALCTYNGERYLAEQFHSIIHQERLPDEIIICDDASQDTTLALIYTLVHETAIPTRIIQNKTNLGVARNFEQAIKLCTGDIIFLVDQDDIWLPNKVSSIEAIFKQKDVGLVFSNAEIIDDSSQVLNKHLWESVYFSQALQQQMIRGNSFQVLMKQNYITGATMAFRARYRDLLVPISPLWIHDAWIAIILSIISNIEFIDEPVMQYRIHNANTIGTSKRGWREWLQKARQTSPTYFEDGIKTFQDLELFLSQSDLANLDVVNREIRRKILHLQSRADITKRGVWSWHLVARELLSANYNRYSMGGVRAAIRDMVASISQDVHAKI